MRAQSLVAVVATCVALSASAKAEIDHSKDTDRQRFVAVPGMETSRYCDAQDIPPTCTVMHNSKVSDSDGGHFVFFEIYDIGGSLPLSGDF